MDQHSTLTASSLQLLQSTICVLKPVLKCGKLTSEHDPGGFKRRLHDAQLKVRAQQAEQVVEVGHRQLGVPQDLQRQEQRLCRALSVCGLSG